jgi:predicted ArsR family transcriptional regulator
MTRQEILLHLKKEGASSIQEIASQLGVTFEAIRQQILLLEREGWVQSQYTLRGKPKVGRPTRHYALTPAGDHLFPKHYDLLAGEVVKTLAAELGIKALRKILASLTEARVREWAPKLEGKTLEERIKALKGLYFSEDPFTSVESGPKGISLIERNCPFLNVALEHPALCSVTLSTLTRLLGFRVIRTERFQSGHGRCVFKVLTDRPVDPRRFRFEFEPEPQQKEQLSKKSTANKRE